MSRLTRLDSYEGAEKQWRQLLSSSAVDTLFTTPEWQRIWWEQFGQGSEMLLLCLKNGNDIEGIAPLARRDGTITFIGGQDLCDYSDFLVYRGAESRFYPTLLDHLDGEKWETIELFSLQESSPTLVYLPELARERGYSVDVQEEDVAPGLSLPDTWDAYLQGLSKKDRHELRRKFRRLCSSAEKFRYYSVSDPVEVEKSLADFFRLMRYSKEDKHRFLTEDRERFFRNIAMEMAGAGILKLFFLEISEERVATALCFDYGQSRFLYNSGFDPSYGYYSVGVLLKALCVKGASKMAWPTSTFSVVPNPTSTIWARRILPCITCS